MLSFDILPAEIAKICEAIVESEAAIPEEMTRGQILPPFQPQTELEWLQTTRDASFKRELFRELEDFSRAVRASGKRVSSSSILQRMREEKDEFERRQELSATTAAENAASWEAAERLEGTWWHRFS